MNPIIFILDAYWIVIETIFGVRLNVESNKKDIFLKRQNL